MNRRAFVTAASAVAVAGCSALASDPQLSVTIDGGDVFEAIEPLEINLPTVGGLGFDLYPTSGTYDLTVIDATRKPELFVIGEETRSVDLHGESDWELPIDVVARGGQDHLLDSASIQRGEA